MPIIELSGDATEPRLMPGKNVLCHIVNTYGKWGAGFVVPLGKKYPKARESYLRWYANQINFEAGTNQVVVIEPGFAVVNMLAQIGLRTRDNPKPLSYEYLELCLTDLALFCMMNNCENVHMPHLIGCGLGGGAVSVVTALIEKCLCNKNLNVFSYSQKAG